MCFLLAAVPVVFIVVIIPLQLPGFDPWTFGSKAQSLTCVATAPAWISLPKLRVVLSFAFIIAGFACK